MGKMVKLVWAALQAIGAALDIRDLSTLIRRTIQGAGLAPVVVGIVNWIGNAVPTLTLVLFGIGAFLLSLLIVPDLWALIRQEAPVARRGTARDVRFDPHLIFTQLARADLSGLFAPESYMTVTMNVSNVSGHAVKIKGVEGRIRCCGEECNTPATVEQAPRRLSTVPSDRVSCMIRQPLSDAMVNLTRLKGIYGDGRLTFSLDGLKWTGTVSLPEGPVDLENCHLGQGDFVVQGPVREKEDGSTLFLLGPRFVSSRWYSSDGLRKQDT